MFSARAAGMFSSARTGERRFFDRAADAHVRRRVALDEAQRLRRARQETEAGTRKLDRSA